MQTTKGQPMTELSNTPLPTLAEMANEAAAACEQSARRTVQQAATCGRALLAAKEQVPHGEWMSWVQLNFTHGHAQATRYMQVANYAASHSLDDAMSVQSVLRLIADERAAERATTTSPPAKKQPVWQDPAYMPPAGLPASWGTIVDHKATQTPAERQQAPQKPVQAARLTHPEHPSGGLGRLVGKASDVSTDGSGVNATLTQATQQPAEPIEPEIVRETSVLVFQRRQMLRVGRLYILTPEGFDEVDP